MLLQGFPARPEETVLIVSHAADMDGVASALIATWLADYEYPSANACTRFIDYGEVDELIKFYASRKWRAVYICDLSFKEDPRAKFLAGGTEVVRVFDHHATSRKVHVDCDTFVDGGFDDSGAHCAASLVWEYYCKTSNLGAPSRLYTFVERIKAGDLWLKDHSEFKKSRRLSKALNIVGPQMMLTLLDDSTYDPYDWAPGTPLAIAEEISEKAEARSREVVKASLIKEAYKVYKEGEEIELSIFFAMSCGYQSDLASKLLEDCQLVALFDVLTNSVSLRMSSEAPGFFGVDCRQIAEKFDGGGHPKAAGFGRSYHYYKFGLDWLVKDLFLAIDELIRSN